MTNHGQSSAAVFGLRAVGDKGANGPVFGSITIALKNCASLRQRANREPSVGVTTP